MEKFTTWSGVAAPMPRANVDTDLIVPKQFLKTIKRTGLGAALFHDLRHDPADGSERADFVLNRPPYRKAKILIAGENFGCGSSREHAPWALADFGIRCVIAPSFADIFFNNSAKNGMLLITLPGSDVDTLMADAEAGGTLTVDLAAQSITRPGGPAIAFEVDAFRKDRLLNGLDDIGLTMQKSAEIDAFEERVRTERPWL